MTNFSLPKRTLTNLVAALNFWLKPKHFSESWDKVGLILAGSEDKEDKNQEKVVDKIMVCLDLTPPVLKEAIYKKVDLIVAYHSPTLGMNMSRANPTASWKVELIAECEANDIAIYSPHSSLDAVAGGMNDCIIEKVLKPIFSPNSSPLEVKAARSSRLVKGMRKTGLCFASNFQNVSILFDAVKEREELADVVVELEAVGQDKGAATASMKIFTREFKEEEIILNISEGLGIPELMSPWTAEIGAYGSLRVVDLPAAVPLSEIVLWVKTGLELDFVQVSGGCSEEFVRRVAVCGGSGTSLIGVPADLFITGEMNHHSLLEADLTGIPVILCSHAGSERHFLPNLVLILKMLTGSDQDQVFLSELEGSSAKMRIG